MNGYLDHAATGPMRPEAVDAMMPYFSSEFANPSGAHRAARAARRVLEDAREEFAELVGARAGEVIFTSGGTESDNLAIYGLGVPGGVAVCSQFEHHAVLDPVEAEGGVLVPVDETGVISIEQASAILSSLENVRVVSFMAVNNEIGVIQPLSELAKIVRRKTDHAVFHSDAVQAFCWTDPTVLLADVDSFSLSAHKFGGPKGVGALIVRTDVPVHARQLGGGQERERRSGTQNVPGIVGMVTAARLCANERNEEVARLSKLRDKLLDGLLQAIPDAIETAGSDRTQRAGGIAHLCFPGVESEALLFLLERQDVYASAASSCASGAVQISHVLTAMGIDSGVAKGSLRLSLGWSSTEEDVDLALRVIPPAVERLRQFGV